MLKSMTGYGEAQHEADGISYFLEIKALNNRFLKTVIKLSDPLSFAEPEIDRIIRSRLNRGSITYVLHMRNMGDMGPFVVNHAAVEHYFRNLEDIMTRNAHDTRVQVDLASLLQLPGVCQVRQYSEEEHQCMLTIVQRLTEEGLDKLEKMRVEEGKGIVVDLKKNCQAIRQNLADLAKLAHEAVMNYQNRLEKRVNELLSNSNLKIDEEMLAKEVALYAERSDINEEISRLTSHLDQFGIICDNNNKEQAGRRLDFLTQEMLREANTIGSKSNHAQISQHVVEIKAAIDRLKEQVQNVE